MTTWIIIGLLGVIVFCLMQVTLELRQIRKWSIQIRDASLANEDEELTIGTRHELALIREELAKIRLQLDPTDYKAKNDEFFANLRAKLGRNNSENEVG